MSMKTLVTRNPLTTVQLVTETQPSTRRVPEGTITRLLHLQYLQSLSPTTLPPRPTLNPGVTPRPPLDRQWTFTVPFLTPSPPATRIRIRIPHLNPTG